MAAQYAAGSTLEEVGQKYGLTRERIRQLLKKHGFNLDELKVSSRSARKRQKTEELETFISDRLKGGADFQSIAHDAGVSLSTVERLGRVDHDLVVMARVNRKRLAPLYSEAEILECLRVANRLLGGVMTSVEYEGVAVAQKLDDGRDWPGRQTAMGRFGSWRKALVAAGLPANPSSAIAGQRQYEAEHCIDAILEVERSLGHAPSAREYDLYARSNGGLPSLSTVRHRHGQWHVAVARAIAFRRSTA